VSGNGNSGSERQKFTVLKLVYDHQTCQVQIDVHDAPCGLLQMMLGEAARQLDEQRRAAMALQLRHQIVKQDQDAAIAQAVRSSMKA